MFRAISFSRLHRACLNLGVIPALANMNALVRLGCVQLSLQIFRRLQSRKVLSCALIFPGLDVRVLNECSKSSGIFSALWLKL